MRQLISHSPRRISPYSGAVVPTCPYPGNISRQAQPVVPGPGIPRVLFAASTLRELWCQQSAGSSINIAPSHRYYKGNLAAYEPSSNSELPNGLFITSERQPWYFQCLLVSEVKAPVINELTENSAICYHRLCKENDRLCSCAYPSVRGNPDTIQPAGKEAEAKMGHSHGFKIILSCKNNQHIVLQMEVQRDEEGYCVLHLVRKH